MTTIQPAVMKAAAAPAATSLGSEIDADIAALKARVATLEANAESFIHKQVAWVEANWPHLVTWAITAGVAVKTGVLSFITKL